MASGIKSFSFLVLAYNHEKYIIEHLESIKYLVLTYADEIDVDLIVNDDSSKDNTVSLVESWLDINHTIFSRVVRIYNERNKGTCASVLNMIDRVESDACKLTAGDDVYSFENIFNYAWPSESYSVVSGVALDLTCDVLSEKKIETFNAVASQVIYQNKPMLDRFKHLSLNNAPNIIYGLECLKNINVQRFLREYDVVEDWPLQVAIAESYPCKKFKLIDKTFVYYRRTPGSTYLVAGSRFFRDKVKVFEYLIKREQGLFARLRIATRLFCFKSSNKLVNKIFNLDFYVYAALVFLNGLTISKVMLQREVDLSKHVDHYRHIAAAADSFLNAEDA